VSMGSIAARHARIVLENVQRILAIELLAAAQALDFRLGLVPGVASGVGVQEAHGRVRSVVAHLDGDREPGSDLAAAFDLVRDGTLVDLAASVAAGTGETRR
jgi:histidine ammonia-lyase